MKKQRFSIIGVALVAMMLASGNVSAGVHKHCLGKNLKFDGNSETLYYSPTSFPAGNWRDALIESINQYNNNPGKFSYKLKQNDDLLSHANFESEVWGSTDISAPAYASHIPICYWFFGKHVWISAVDVVFNYKTPWRWTTTHNKNNLWKYNGACSGTSGCRGIQGTALHELGHGLHLAHENDEYNIMGNDFEHVHVNGDRATFYLGEDAADGAVHLYGNDNSYQDLGVVHWKYDAANTTSEYSNHKRTQVYNSAGTSVVSRTWVDYQGDGNNDERHFKVSPGQSVKAEFTFENNGASTHKNVSVGYYLSTNNYCTTWDTKLTSTTMTLGRADVYTYKKGMTIPSTVTVGQNYWLCAIVDDNGAIAEAWEGNNATWLPLRIQ